MAVTTIPRDPASPILPDLDSAATAHWPDREFVGEVPRTGTATVVLVPQSVQNQIQQHGQSRTDVEVCGVLVGRGYRTATGPVLFVSAAIRGEHATHQAAQVTFTAATWNHVQQVLERDFPELQIVGWYHTHPGFGIFLSDMDLFIHRHFFSGSEQLAWVYDPIGGDQGIFVWRAGEAVRESVMILADEPPLAGSGLDRLTRQPSLTADAATEEVFAARLQRLERRQRGLGMCLLAVTALSLVWPWYLTRGVSPVQETVEAFSRIPRTPSPSATRRPGPNPSPQAQNTLGGAP